MKKTPVLPTAAVLIVLVLGACASKPVREKAETPEQEPGVFLSFVDTPRGKPINVEYMVYPAGNHAEQLVWQNGDSAALALEDGVYDVLVRWETGELWMQGVQVREEERLEREISLGLGRLRGAFLDVENGKAQDVEYFIYRSGERNGHLVWCSGEELDHLLSAGAYDHGIHALPFRRSRDSPGLGERPGRNASIGQRYLRPARAQGW